MSEKKFAETMDLAVAEVVMGWSHEQAMRVAEFRQARGVGALQSVFEEWASKRLLGDDSRHKLNVWILSADPEE